MKDVYISLGFFALSGVALCVLAKIGRDLLLVFVDVAEPGVGAAGFIFGAAWGLIFAAVFTVFRAAGREAAVEMQKAQRPARKRP